MRREKGAENLLKQIMAENFPNIQSYMNTKIYEAPRTPNKINAEKMALEPTLIKLSKLIKRILKAARKELVVTHKAVAIVIQWISLQARKV